MTTLSISYNNVCGEGGIRTLGTVARTHDFQSCTFGHSVTSPCGPVGLAGWRGRRLCQTEEREQDLVSQRARRTRRMAASAAGSGESGIRTPANGSERCEALHNLVGPRANVRSRTPTRRSRTRAPWRRRRVTGSSGESGIRTHGTLTGTPDFESGTFGRSVISPPRTMTAGTDPVNERKPYKNRGFAAW